MEGSFSCLIYYLFLDVWISGETLLLVFDILLLGVWISDEILLLVFDLLPFQRMDETPYASCLTYDFSDK